MEKENISFIIIMISIFFGFFMISYIQASVESKTFNRCTGANTTAFEAFFTNLRVIECNQANQANQ